MSASDLDSLAGYHGSSQARDNGPLPTPPKLSGPSATNPHTMNARSSSQKGPPLPPPPPSHPATPSVTTASRPNPLQKPPAPPPPRPGEPWLPAILAEKTTQQLAPVLGSPEQLKALAQTHPCLHPKNSPLPPLLAQTAQMSSQLSQQHAQLLVLRDRTQAHLLHLHALERQWREKQAQLDQELEPWSAKTLYGRLREAEQEAEIIGEGLERSWLDGDGIVEEREVADFLRGFREGRGKLWRRREMRERWDEGRVGGWR